MNQPVKMLVTMLEALSSVPETHMTGQNQPLKVVFQPPHMHRSTCSLSAHTLNNNNNK